MLFRSVAIGTKKLGFTPGACSAASIAAGSVPTNDFINDLICGRLFVTRSGSSPIVITEPVPARFVPSAAVIDARAPATCVWP